MEKSNIEKWKDGSIVDDWMKSKAYQKFHFYHPYPTYSDNSIDCFVKPDGTRCDELTADTEALFILGEKAFSRLPKAATSKDFDGALAGYFQFIDELRDSLSKSYKEGRFTISNTKGDVYQPNFDEADNGWILDLAWNCFAKPLSSLSGDREEIATCYQEAFLFHVFWFI